MTTATSEPSDANVSRALRWYWRDHGFPELPLRERVRARAAQRPRPRPRDRATSGPTSSPGGRWAGCRCRCSSACAGAGCRRWRSCTTTGWTTAATSTAGSAGWRRGRRRARRAVGALTGIPSDVDLATAARYVFVSESTRRRARAAGDRPGVEHRRPVGDRSRLPGPAPPSAPGNGGCSTSAGSTSARASATAIAALAELPEAELRVIGGWDEAEERRLHALAGELGVAERVRFDGQQGRDGVHAAYGDADVIVFPVVWEEPWGLVPLESMARGRPVVATGRGGSAEYLRDGENALLFEAEDARRARRRRAPPRRGPGRCGRGCAPVAWRPRRGTRRRSSTTPCCARSS